MLRAISEFLQVLNLHVCLSYKLITCWSTFGRRSHFKPRLPGRGWAGREGGEGPECFPATCFQIQVLEGTPNVLLLVISHLSIHLWSRILFRFLVPFLPLSNRIVHTKSKLLCTYWADVQSEWFGTRVRCSKHPHWSVWCLCHSSCSEFHDSKHWYSWIPDDLCLWIFPPSDWLWSSIFLQVGKEEFHTTSFRSQAEECPVSLQQSLRVILDFLKVRNTNSIISFVQSMSKTLTWRRSGTWIFQVQCFFLAHHLGFSEESAMSKIQREYSTRIQLLLLTF